jgi:hypothetical protein
VPGFEFSDLNQLATRHPKLETMIREHSEMRAPAQAEEKRNGGLR